MAVSATQETWTPPTLPDTPRRFSRRRLLVGTAAIGTLAIAGPLGYRATFARGTPAPGMSALTRGELATITAIAEVYFPAASGLPAPRHAITFFDSYLADLPSDLQRLMKLAIRSIEWSAVLTGGELSRLSRTSLASRTAVLDAWEISRSYVRRTGIFSIKWALAMGYFENPQVREAIGWMPPCEHVADASPEWL